LNTYFANTMSLEENLISKNNTLSRYIGNQFEDSILLTYQQIIQEFNDKIEQQNKKIIELESKINAQNEEINKLKQKNQNQKPPIKQKLPIKQKQHSQFSSLSDLSNIESKILEKNNRKVFCLDNARMIYAGGCLLYKIVNNQIFFLMIYSDWRKAHEDIGGKVDNNDKTVYGTVIREAMEETNHIIKLNKDRLTSSPHFYNNEGKYILFLVEANDEESQTTVKDFGPKELYENIERTIDWIKCDDFIQKKIKVCQRINMYHIIEYLKSKSINYNNDNLNTSSGEDSIKKLN
jgi:NUDIX domain